MEFLANELSFHGQFHDVPSFRSAFGRLMEMRKVIQRFGRDVYCHRTLPQVMALPSMSVQQALGRLSRDEQRSALLWMTKLGPFWDDVRSHACDDWLECGGEIVTDCAVGEAAYRTLHGVESGVISAAPSDWNYSPVEVRWRRDAGGLEDRSATLENWWDVVSLERWLQEAPAPIDTWEEVRTYVSARFRNLTFSGGSFDPLMGHPFNRSSADRIVVLLSILSRLAGAFDHAGTRTPEGGHLYRQYFTGRSALFSDSSDSEKRDFRKDLTFLHPTESGRSLFCPWHGKERRMTLRVHFSWPVRFGEPVYVVYVGPKMTKR